jgi:hypothetical protein
MARHLMFAFEDKADVRGKALKSPLLARSGHKRTDKVPVWMRNRTPDYEIGLKYQNFGGEYQCKLGFQA